MKFTRKIIGFRSGRLRNKIIASLGYFVFIVGLLGQPSSAPTPWDAFVQMLLWTLLFLIILIPAANLFSIRKKLFFFNRLSFFGKVFGVIGYALIALIVCATIGAGLKSVTAKQMEAKQQALQQITTKVATDSKVKTDEEAKVKAEAEAKAKAEQEAKLKAEADAKAKSIANAKAQAAVAADKKKEADAAKAKAEQQAKAQAAAQARADAQAQTSQTQNTVAATPAPQQQATVQILGVSDPAPRNSMATLTAKVTPGATAYIAVHYKSGDSTAQGLEPKQADANGNVSWSWHVGGRTTIGTWPITVTCNGASSDTQFTVVH